MENLLLKTVEELVVFFEVKSLMMVGREDQKTFYEDSRCLFARTRAAQRDLLFVAELGKQQSANAEDCRIVSCGFLSLPFVTRCV